MALTFPRDFPDTFKVKTFSMKIVRQVHLAQTRGGLVQAAERGRPLWQIVAEMALLGRANLAAQEAFFESLRGPINPFRISHLGQRRPIAYPGTGWAGFTRHGGASFNGTATVSAASGYSVSLTSLPSTYIVSPGDMISWPWRSSRTLHRVVEGGTAVGGAITIQVEPDVPAGGTLPQTVMLEAATALFRMTEETESVYRRNFGEGLGFTAIQALY